MPVRTRIFRTHGFPHILYTRAALVNALRTLSLPFPAVGFHTPVVPVANNRGYRRMQPAIELILQIRIRSWQQFDYVCEDEKELLA